MCRLLYRGADKSLAQPGRKQATATEGFIFIYPIYNHNWRNISTFYTGCPGWNVPDFGRMFLKLKYTDIIKNTYIQS